MNIIDLFVEQKSEFENHPLIMDVRRTNKKIGVYNSGMYCSDEQLIIHDFSMIYSLMSLFSDIDKAPFFLLEETLKTIITESISCGVFSSGNKYTPSYLGNMGYYVDSLNSFYKFKTNSMLFGFEAREKRKRDLNILVNSTIVVEENFASLLYNFNVPTRYKNFSFNIAKIKDKYRIGVPKLSKERNHPELDFIYIDSQNSNVAISEINKLVSLHYKHRIFYSHFKRLFDKYYGYDVEFEGIDMSSSLDIIEAINY